MTLVVAAIACFRYATVASAATTYYVDCSQPNGDGSSWSAPFKYLADALVAANAAGDVVRVAGGVYRPDQTYSGGTSNDPAASFDIGPGVKVEGGYKGGGGVDAGTRDLALYPTKLRGEIGGTARSDNSSHVVTIEGDDPIYPTVLDGFQIEDGFAFGDTGSFTCGGDDIPATGGAGLHCFSASNVSIRDCEFRYNQARTGAAIRLLCSSPKIVNCTFERNSASSPEDAADLDLRDEE